MKPPKPPELVVTLLAAALLVGSAMGLTRIRDDASAEPAGPRGVTIADFAFGPADLAVSVGDTVTWTSTDRATHTVTATDGETLESPDLMTGDTFEVTLETAGSVEYICKFHPNMRGTITVEG
jgi:plastocyanin